MLINRLGGPNLWWLLFPQKTDILKRRVWQGIEEPTRRHNGSVSRYRAELRTRWLWKVLCRNAISAITSATIYQRACVTLS